MLAFTLALMLVMNGIGQPLNDPQAAPLGIISYELAGSPPQAETILNAWDASARQHAALSLGLDYLFMVAYAVTIALGCVWAARSLGAPGMRIYRLGILLAWGQGIAGLADATENVALITQLFRTPASPWPEIAQVCTLVKFGLILLGMIYAFFAAILRLATRRAQKTPATF
jgi:hypothetical protein